MELEEKEMESEKEDSGGEYDKWELQSCVDTLIRAEEIKADKAKMAAIKPLMEKKLASLKKAFGGVGSLEDVKKIRQKKAEEEMD